MRWTRSSYLSPTLTSTEAEWADLLADVRGGGWDHLGDEGLIWKQGWGRVTLSFTGAEVRAFRDAVKAGQFDAEVLARD